MGYFNFDHMPENTTELFLLKGIKWPVIGPELPTELFIRSKSLDSIKSDLEAEYGVKPLEIEKVYTNLQLVDYQTEILYQSSENPSDLSINVDISFSGISQN